MMAAAIVAVTPLGACAIRTVTVHSIVVAMHTVTNHDGLCGRRNRNADGCSCDKHQSKFLH